MIITSDLIVRNLNQGESLPSWINPAMLMLPNIDTSWIWVAESRFGKEAVLIAGDLHGIALLWRLEANSQAPHNAVLQLLRQAIAQIKARGYSSFVCFLSGTEAKELKLARIIQRIGGQLIPVSGYWGVGKCQH